MREPTHPNTALPGREGFTVIELLVVISIMIILLAALAPAIFNVDADGRLTGAKNAIQSGAQAARALATRKRASLLDLPAANDSGTALIITPSGEMRLTINDQRASNGGDGLELRQLNGFKDAPGRDYYELPKGIGVAGIIGPLGSNNSVVPPPFAVRYDEQGGLVSGVPPGQNNPTTFAFYDANFDGRYDFTSFRVNYDPKDYDPETADGNPNYLDQIGVWRLPFEGLEPVIGVIVYSKGEFEDRGLNWGSPNDAITWLTAVDAETGNLLNGKLLLFSRGSGSGL